MGLSQFTTHAFSLTHRPRTQGSLGRAAQHFLEGRDAVDRFLDAVLAQGAHPRRYRQLLQLQSRSVPNDGVGELIIHDQQLVDRVAAVVTASAALLAAHTTLKLATLDLIFRHADPAKYIRVGGVL